MSDRNAFDRQLEREIDNLAGPEPRVDVRHIVEGATAPRRRWTSGGWGALRLIGSAAAMVLVVGLGIGFLFGSDRAVAPVPAASPTAEPTPAGPGADGETSVTGTWTMPDSAACAEGRPMGSEDWIVSLEICDGLRFDTPDDPRLTGEGQIRFEEWDEGSTPEIWRVFTASGWWESQRHHDHDRFVFSGKADHDGLTAVVTLADDGTLSGFIREGEPRGDDDR